MRIQVYEIFWNYFDDDAFDLFSSSLDYTNQEKLNISLNDIHHVSTPRAEKRLAFRSEKEMEQKLTARNPENTSEK